MLQNAFIQGARRTQALRPYGRLCEPFALPVEHPYLARARDMQEQLSELREELQSPARTVASTRVSRLPQLSVLPC